VSIFNTLKDELCRNGQTIGLSVAITLLLVWISNPTVIFLAALVAVLVAYLLGDTKFRLPWVRRSHLPPKGYGPYEEPPDEYGGFDADDYPHNHHGG